MLNFPTDADNFWNPSVGELLINLWYVLETNTEQALLQQSDDGSMPPGCNGPYKDRATPVRNTAHWLKLFLALAERKQSKSYREAAEKCADYLCSDKVRPTGRLFQNRRETAKDEWNGLIGQVWALEPLLLAGKVLGREDCLETFSEVVGYLPFDKDAGLWRIAASDLDERFSLTLNQQIWMAALLARATALGYENYFEMIEIFLSRLADHVHVKERGIFHQAITPLGYNKSIKERMMIFSLRNVRIGHHLKAIYRYLRWGRYVNLGYHTFTLLGLAYLRQTRPDHYFWTHSILEKALNACIDPSFLSTNSSNPFGNGYHLVGIEAAFSFLVFDWRKSTELLSVVQHFVAHDLRVSFDHKTAQAASWVSDPATITARLYESVDLIDALECRLN